MTTLGPRQRRLASDRQRLEALAEQSTIFSFTTPAPLPRDGAAEVYRVRFRGPSLQASSHRGQLEVRGIDEHEVLIQLVAEYPRSAPHMRWLTPLFHPNVSAAGAVCLGGWGTHWAPSLQLDRLCEMLWDMLRFANYDTRSPYNQQAAAWLLAQRTYRLPLDPRELRDSASRTAGPASADAARIAPPPDILFLD
ncbi:ubiquitin-conjugating enzyme E2 [Candidatus Laterigemmans baculatus]|uniref:ubiquitin-conjugating enzyme E2 n=1 Tax=Candidatus Laterigemmans baculatus TaxID=2770505 RepID=UPI0013DBC86C|nr:ubiquitin-conjugating enzyme E2 [Candidatus Laterigemmans baculatus]